jgi:hypothetical protein
MGRSPIRAGSHFGLVLQADSVVGSELDAAEMQGRDGC